MTAYYHFTTGAFDHAFTGAFSIEDIYVIEANMPRGDCSEALRCQAEGLANQRATKSTASTPLE